MDFFLLHLIDPIPMEYTAKMQGFKKVHFLI